MKTEIVDIYRNYEDATNLAKNLIDSGEVFAFPTETVYGIGCRLDKYDSIEGIYRIKGRSYNKPMSIHISSFNQLKRLGIVIPDWFSDRAKEFMPGPITIIVPKPVLQDFQRVGDLETIGIRYPNNKFFLDIVNPEGLPLLATSANKSGSVSPKNAEEVYKELHGKIRYIFDGGISKYKEDSTVITLIDKKIEILRHGAVSKEQLGY